MASHQLSLCLPQRTIQDAEYGLTQRISRCDRHSGRYGLNPNQGRGAPELDLLETIICSRQMTPHLAKFGAQQNDTCLISSLQLAPRLPGSLRPVLLTLPSEDRPWYSDSVSYGPRSTINAAFYGMNNYDTIGAMTVLDKSAYESFHTVALDIEIGAACNLTTMGTSEHRAASKSAACLDSSHLTYYHDGVVITRINGTAFRTRGGLLGRQFPMEPMYILLGLKLSPDRWGKADHSVFPLDFQIDYVRLYQDLAANGGSPRLQCSPPDHPTAKWITDHHLEYGVPGESFVSIADLAAMALLIAGPLIAIAGSIELRGLVLIGLSLIISAGAMAEFFRLTTLPGASEVLFAPAYLPLMLALAFLANLIPMVTAITHALGMAMANGVLAVQLSHHFAAAAATAAEAHPSSPPSASAIPLVMVASGVLPIASSLLNLPPAYHEALTAALVGSQAAAMGGAHFLDCMWLSNLMHSLGVSPSDTGPNPGGSTESEPPLLYATVVLALLGAAYQYVRHACRGSLRPRRLQTVQAAAAAYGELPNDAEIAWHQHLTTSRGYVRQPSSPFGYSNWLQWSPRGSSWLRRRASRRQNSLQGKFRHRMYDSPVGEPLNPASTPPSSAHDPRNVRSPSEVEESAFEAALARELDFDSAVRDASALSGQAPATSAGGTWMAVRPSPESLVGLSDLSALRHLAIPITRTLGLQEASVEVQCRHLHALLADARRNGRDEAEAAQSVHRELTSNYSMWCAGLGVSQRSCGILEDCMLLLCVWGEAANLRHMPELLCWLFHQLCAHRATLFQATASHSRVATPPRRSSTEPANPAIPPASSAAPQASIGLSPPADGPGSPVLCYSFLASVVNPLIEVTRWRMRAELPAEHKLTYDDLNEFFWAPDCLSWLPFAHDGPRCVCIALRRCPKSHMEARKGGWLHLLHCFHRPLLFSLTLTWISSTLAYCATAPTPIGLYVARLSLLMWLFSVYCLNKELLDTWAEASLIPKSIDAPTALHQALTVWRVLVKAGYTSAMGAVGISAALTTGCNAAGCFGKPNDVPPPNPPPHEQSWLPDPETGLLDRWTLHSTYASPLAVLGLAGAADRWVLFWTLGLLQMIGYTLYSRLQRTFPIIRLIFGTPYRAARIGERFYGVNHFSTRDGIIFWIVLSLIYLVMHFTIIATPSAKGHSNFVVLRASGASSASEFAALLLALWLPAIPTGIIVTDVLFQVLVVALSLGLARCCCTVKRTAPPRRRKADGFEKLSSSYRLCRSTFLDQLQTHPLPKEPGASSADVTDVSISDRVAGSADAGPSHFGDATSSDESAAAEVGEDPFGCSWDAIVAQLRTRDLLSDTETRFMSHVQVTVGSRAWLLAPPLFLAPSIDAYLRTGKPPQTSDDIHSMDENSSSRAGPVEPCVESGLEGACLLTQGIACSILGAEVSADIDIVARGLRQLVAPVSFERMQSGPLREAVDATSALCRALSAPTTLMAMPPVLRAFDRVLDSLQEMKQFALRNTLADTSTGEAAAAVEAALRRLQTACGGGAGSTAAAGNVGQIATTDAGSACANLSEARRLAWLLGWLLEPSSSRARPACEEARRRIQNFVRSLQMRMPRAVRISEMTHVSMLTPVYRETILFSLEELRSNGSDGRPLLDVLRELYAEEWANMCERTGLPLEMRVEQLMPRGPLEAHSTEVRIWASMRGQTLCRTVCGMMSYQAALRLQARLEGEADAEAVVSDRFEYLVACQMYGEQKREGDAKADDIDLLLRMHPGLRVAYVDRTPPAVGSAGEGTFDAVLLVSDGSRGVEMARVRLPGNPILGEGKPENQNVGLPFTRGSKLMILDMNQDGYFEEALKLRNLLQEFEGRGAGAAGHRPVVSEGVSRPANPMMTEAGAGGEMAPVTIVGFPEHIFTQSAGFVTAIYMAMQERYFGTFFQRVLSDPLGVRFHYGHPDLLDKIHFMTRGGVSSASKQINLSEDVFAGYRTVLRGGRIVFREYHQVGKGRMTNLSEISAFFAKLSQGAACQLMSRDLYRLAKALPLERQLSLLHGGFGFYIVNCLTMYLVQATAFLLAVLNVSGLLPYFQTGSAVALTSINLWMPLLVALVLLLPDAVMVWHERGTRLGLHYLYGKVVTLAPLYYIFIAQTRAYHFANTMRWGSADYYVTKRAVSITHVSLHELFMAYARSHFYPAVELLVVLVVAISFSAPSDMYNDTWMLWFIALALLYVPFLYNPNALQMAALRTDLTQLRQWLSKDGIDGNASMSWRAWWEGSTPAGSAHGTATIVGQAFMASVYAYLAGGVLLYSNTELDGSVAAAFNRVSLWQLSLGGAIVVPAMVLAAFDQSASTRMRALRPLLMVSLLVGAVSWFVGVTQLVDIVDRERVQSAQWAGAWAKTYYAVPSLVMHTIACNFGLAGVAAALTILQTHLRPARDALRWLHRTRDYLLLAAITAPLHLLSLMIVPHFLQTRLVFQGSAFFFSDTPRGRAWCAASFTIFALIVLGWVLYSLLWFLGYVNAPPFGWFAC